MSMGPASLFYPEKIERELKIGTIADRLSSKAKEKFGAQNPDEVLRKAILMAITHIGKAQNVVVDRDGSLEVTVTDYDARGKIMVVQVEFDEDAVRDYIEKAAPELTSKVGKPGWGMGSFVSGGLHIPKPFETICPESYLRYQNAVVESLNNIAENWF